MKTYAAVFLSISAIVVGWNFYQDNFREDESNMEKLHASVERHGMNCAITEDLYDHTWMRCRYPGTSKKDQMGSVWVLHEDSEGEMWVSRNGPAIQVVNRFNQLSLEDQSKQVRIHTASVEENMEHGFIHLPSVPWDELN